MRSCVSSLRLLGVRLIGWFWMNMTCIILSSLTLVKVHARCRGGALGRAIATVVYRQGQHEGLEECTQARRHQEFPLARLAARLGHMARDGRYNDGGTAGARCVEVWRDGEALRALRAGAIASGGRQTGCY